MNPAWKNVWKMDTPPAIHLVIWKYAHRTLSTNAKTASALTYIDRICNL